MPVDLKELLKAFEQQKKIRNKPVPPVAPSPLLPFGLTASSGNPQLDMAKTLLSNAKVDWQNISGLNKDPALDRDTSGPSVISRLFDILSRPNYMVANAVKAAQDDLADNSLGDILREGWEGLAGQDKTTFSDVIQQQENMANPDWVKYAMQSKQTGSPMPADVEMDSVRKFMGGFFADVALDPLNAIGANTVKKAGSLFGLGSKTDLESIPNSVTNFTLKQQANEPLPDNLLPTILTSAKSNAQPSLQGVFSNALASDKPLAGTPPVDFNQDVIGSFPKIDKIAKNAARQRHKSEITKQFKELYPDLDKTALGKMVGLYMMENMPKSGTPQFKDVTAGISGTNAAKDVLADIQKIYKTDDLKSTITGIISGGNALTSIGRKLKPKDQNVIDKISALYPDVNINDNPADIYDRLVSDAAKPLFINKSLADTDDVAPAETILDKLIAGDFTTTDNLSAQTKSRMELLEQIGEAGLSEHNSAAKLADKFIEDTLTLPNKFQKGDAAPAILNPAQQANYATRIASLSRKTKGKLDTFKMLRVGEEYLNSAGFSPSYWDGTNVRLTDVILELAQTVDDIPKIMGAYLPQVITAFRTKDPSKVLDPNVRQAIENLRTRNAINDAPQVNVAVQDALQKKDILSEVLSPAKLNEFQKVIEREASLSLTKADVSPGSITTTQKLLRDIHNQNLNATPPLAATQAKKNYIQSYVAGNERRWAPVQQAQTKGIEDVTGVSAKSLSTRIGESNRAVDWFLSRVATWYGQTDLRPEVLINTMTAANNASARARAWNSFAAKYTPEDIADGFRAAQGIKTAATPEIQKAADYLSKAMESLFSSTGISSTAEKAASVAERSGMVLTDLNEQLTYVNSPFKFSNEVITELDQVYDYSKGTDWLKSWERAKVDDPVDFMFRIGTAVEQLMSKYAFYDELAARWGSTTPSKVFNTKIRGSYKERKPSTGLHGMRDTASRAKKDGSPRKPNQPLERHHRLSGLYFPADIAPQIERVLSTWDQIYNPKSDMVRLLDRVTRAWKSGVTIYAPSHHIRNLIGDAYLSWMAGVNNPSVYKKASKVIFSEKGRYNDLESVENLVGRNAIADALTRPGDTVTRTGAGIDLTAEQIYVAAHNTGLLVHANVIEELFGDPLIKWKPLGGRGQEIAHKLSENREHFMRLAHFIDIIEKSKEKNVQKLFKDASKEVRKWHPDGTDLTDFERNVMRRIIPFYSWTRKAIPLLIQGAVLNPGKTTVYPKGMEAIQGMFGIESPDRSDPFPEDQLFPDWMREKGIGPIAEHGMDGLPGLIANLSRSITGFNGEDSGYTIVNPSNPLIDTVAQYAGMGRAEDPLKGIAQGINPLARIPSEILHGETFTGAPIEPGKYIGENIPIAAMFSRISNIGAFGPTSRGEEEGLFNQEALVNLLTALGIQGTGPYIKTAEFQERDRRREQ